MPPRPTRDKGPLPLSYSHFRPSSGLNIIFPLHLREYFTSRGLNAYQVGGPVRDLLLGVQSNDIDIAVEGDPFALGRGLAHELQGSFVPLSPLHRLARIVLPDRGHGRPVIDLAALKGTIEEDLAQRDFTIDAMALPLSAWGTSRQPEEIIDPYGGREDLVHRAIRALRPQVFEDDPVRMLRAVRLAASLNLTIEPDTRHWIAQRAPRLTSCAAERLRDEFLAITAISDAREHLRLMDRLGLLGVLLPEMEHTRGVEQPREHYWDVFNHSIETVNRAERVTEEPWPPSVPNLVPWSQDRAGYFAQEIGDGHTRRTLLKIGALLHDIAKPQTKIIDKNGRTRFFGHHLLGADMTATILARLRFSSKSTHLVCSMVRYHLRPGQLSQGGEFPTRRAVYRYFREVADASVDTLYLSLADYLAARGPEVNVLQWRQRAALVAHILEQETPPASQQKRQPLVDGHDIMERLHLAPGPLVGQLLEMLHEAEAAGEVGDREQALAWAADWLKGHGHAGSCAAESSSLVQVSG